MAFILNKKVKNSKNIRVVDVEEGAGENSSRVDRAEKRLRMRLGSWHENIDLRNTLRMKDPRVS